MANVKLDGYRCERCEHEWFPRERRTKGEPKVCPKCNSAYWDVPRPAEKREQNGKKPAGR